MGDLVAAQDEWDKGDAERPRITVSIEQMIEDARKPLPWVIEKTLMDDTLNLIWGPPKGFKTFVALDMALSQSTGLPFLGKYEVLKTGLVIYVAGEGMAGVSQRVVGWCIDRGIKDVNSETVPFKRTVGALQISGVGALDLAAEIDEIVKETGVPLAGVYIDTLARNFGDGDENSTSDMNAFVLACDTHLKSRFKVPVVIVHHSGHGDTNRPRGAIALMGAVDTMTKVSCNFPKVIYEPNFAKDAETPPAHVLSIETVLLGFNDQFGEPVSSRALKMTDESPEKTKNVLNEDARIALSLVPLVPRSYSEWHQEWLTQASRLPAKHGKNAGKRRDNSSLKRIWSRVVDVLEKEEVVIIERDKSQKALTVELPRATDGGQV